MKKFFKKKVASILGSQIKRLRARHELKVIAITGSIGKTSSKLAISSVLGGSFRVRYQTGNYNDIVSMPLVFFGERMPNIFNPLAWLLIFIKNEIKIRKAYPYEIVVLEVGTDGPGQIAEFGRYLKVDLGVVTAITPEHMEYFADMDEVAREELELTKYASKTLLNADLIKPTYLKLVHGSFITYGISRPANYRLERVAFKASEASFDFIRDGKKIFTSGHQQITEPQLYSVLAAAAVAREFDMSPEQIDQGIRAIPPVSGRMQYLTGAQDSLIIDDTYNASPEAALAALDTLYRMEAKHKIAVLGNMNELGHFSKPEHERVGQHCDPAKLDLVITIGPDANTYLAAAAEARGCKVKTFDSPYKAGDFLRPLLQKDTAVLVKGSQNKVFAEETVKIILDDPADSAKLVRQDPNWQAIKKKAFKH
jgi:UDP-N-acetylmuramoyl-tripeptide--D-alanyl-D-alanine ligase